VFSRSLRISDAVGGGQAVEKVAGGPIDGPKSGQKPPKSVFWVHIWVRRGASQEFFNTLRFSQKFGVTEYSEVEGESPTATAAWRFPPTFVSMNSDMTNEPQLHSVDHRLVRLDLLMHGGLLGVSVVVLTQLLQVKVPELDWKLWISIFCFAVSIPLLSMTVLARTIEDSVDRAPIKGFFLVWSSRLGLVAAFGGIAAVFLHLFGVAFWVFLSVSVFSLLVGAGYYSRVVKHGSKGATGGASNVGGKSE
jgi:hypothetical protein